MKDVKVEVTHHDDRGDPSPPNNYTVELHVGKHRFMLGFYGFTEKAKAEEIATEVRQALGLPTTPASLTLSEVELARAREFTMKHPYGCSSNSFSTVLTATGAGTKVVIKCGGCGEEKDVSDYDSW